MSDQTAGERGVWVGAPSGPGDGPERLEAVADLVPLAVLAEVYRIKREGETGTLEIDFKDGQARSLRLIPPRVRLSSTG